LGSVSLSPEVARHKSPREPLTAPKVKTLLKHSNASKSPH
jgi:hypothetical protein